MNRANPKFRFEPWPHALLAWFVVFAAALAAWITFAVRQRMDLVRPDYYEEEIRFQRQIERLNRTAPLRAGIMANYDAASGRLELRLPAVHQEKGLRGRARFYRPSHASLDVEVPFVISGTGPADLRVGTLQQGHWKLRIEWTAGGHEYFHEETLVVAPVDDPRPGLTGE